jgi:AraC-like DNA-binding protein
MQVRGATAPTAPTQTLASSKVQDVDGYQRSVAGIDIEAVRVGVGQGPNTVKAVSNGLVTATSCQIGFPILTRTTIADDRVLLAAMRTTTPGSRWCEIDLEPGSVLSYGPAAEHAARNLAGLRFAFMTTDAETLLSRADQLGIHIRLPARGDVRELQHPASGTAVAQPLWALFETATAWPVPAHQLDGLLDSMVTAFAARGPWPATHARRRIDRRKVVKACINHAESIGQMPSIAALCGITRLSERRIREAFASEFGSSPTECLRAWALGRVHRRLSSADPSSETVTTAALDAGFAHLGRFAGYYRQIYGEPPSATLARPPA